MIEFSYNVPIEVGMLKCNLDHVNFCQSTWNFGLLQLLNCILLPKNFQWLILFRIQNPSDMCELGIQEDTTVIWSWHSDIMVPHVNGFPLLSLLHSWRCEFYLLIILYSSRVFTNISVQCSIFGSYCAFTLLLILSSHYSHIWVVLYCSTLYFQFA